MKHVALLCCFLLSCASASPFITSGASLKATGDTFVAAAGLMDSAIEQGAVTPAQYRSWVAFGLKFQATFPVAVALWQSALKVNDVALIGKADAIIAVLVQELSAFYQIAADAVKAIVAPTPAVPSTVVPSSTPAPGAP